MTVGREVIVYKSVKKAVDIGNRLAHACSLKHQITEKPIIPKILLVQSLT